MEFKGANKFAVGDKVIDCNWIGDKIFEVSSISISTGVVRLKAEDGGIGYANQSTLKKVGAIEPKVESEFKIGDIVSVNKFDGFFKVIKFTGEGTVVVENTIGGHMATFLDRITILEQEGLKVEPKKFDNGKARLDLVRPEFTLALGEVLAYGADKYSEPVGETPNYLKGDGFNYSRILGSLERHIQQFKMGISIDEESGKHHLAHASANLMFLLTYELTGSGINDIVILGGEDGNKDKETK